MKENELFSKEPMLELFVFEAVQLIEQLEELLIEVEKNEAFDSNCVNDVFRIMHTIKGSSAMMMYNNLTTLSHSIEDLFGYIRENNDANYNCGKIVDIVLRAVDFIKDQISKIQAGENAEDEATDLIKEIKGYLSEISNKPKEVIQAKIDTSKFDISSNDVVETPEGLRKYKVKIMFQDGCMMENIRAFSVVHTLKELVFDIYFEPQDIIENESTSDLIRENGFIIYFSTNKTEETIQTCINQAFFLESFLLEEILEFPDKYTVTKKIVEKEAEAEVAAVAVDIIDVDKEVELQKQHLLGLSNSLVNDKESKQVATKQQNLINVNLTKLDMLMDLVGEIVISEAMVTKNPDLDGLQLDNFTKAARQLRKLTNELQDIVMSIRMLPIAATFHKMNRIVRDMSKKLDKDVELVLIGEETEVDKNIIDNISDPLMHLIRNAIDHGIESKEQRLKSGKPGKSSIILEAKNSGGDVWITVKDDGNGLDKQRIMEKAKQKMLLTKPENEYSDSEIFSFILLPGFSTNEKVSEYSGRGVGMDVVRENIEKIRGSINIDSIDKVGTRISIKIPLTLAIIAGMMVKVGREKYIIPITSIRQSFKPKADQIIVDHEGNELIMIRGQCFCIVRIHNKFHLDTQVTNIEDGILVVIDDGTNLVCLFADELVGEQQVVVKPVPYYIRKVKGLGGCTIQVDGSISLIIDVNGLLARG